LSSEGLVTGVTGVCVITFTLHLPKENQEVSN